MKRTTLLLILTLSMGLAVLVACGGHKDQKEQDAEKENVVDSTDIKLHKRATAVFSPLPEPADSNTDLAKLGKKLYFETALSINGEMSCNSCHLLNQYGVDNEPTSPGHKGERGERNSPSVYNASLHFKQFWDGRADDLAEQAKGPILNPVEMGMPDEATAVKNIKAIEAYGPLFAQAFPNDKEPINYDNIAQAIAAFEQSLITPAPFDKYLAGDLQALNKDQKTGLKLFMDKACITCHIGPAVGGTMFRKFGLVKSPYWDYTGSRNKDAGRKSVTGNDADEHVFKVASLRNVEKTGPYFHDGSVKDLRAAVKVMAMTQLGQELTDGEAKSISDFLGTLTGELPNFEEQTARN